ncbi:MAG: RhuM family protein [Candidatus Omnitrophota bacterium]
MLNKGEIRIYQAKDKNVQIEVKLERETVWLNLNQIAFLFQRDKSVVSRHLRNIFITKELDRDSVVANFATTAVDGKSYHVEYYNLDVIISVGYRVNSKHGTQFRIWATNVLRKHFIDGYTLNEQRLKQQVHKLQALQHAIKLIGSMKERKDLDYKEALGLIEVINDYNYALELLDDYSLVSLRGVPPTAGRRSNLFVRAY